MAIELGDHTSGFRHIEVIRFINNEVLLNGGGPEFYTSFRSRSWSEIEDKLHTIIVDPKVPRSLKRAFTWSALALSVRVSARHREQQTRRVGRLQDQVGARETASWTLASELERLREERDQAAAQLVSTQTSLQEAMDEREVLRGRLLQAERSALDDVPETRKQECRAAVRSHEEEEQKEVGSREAQNTANFGGQMRLPPVLSYLPGLPSHWVQAVHPFLRMPVPHPLPPNSQLPLGFPYSIPVPCPVVMESGARAASMAAAVPQMAPAAMYPHGFWVTLGSQEAMASAWGQVHHRQNECSEFLQRLSHLGDSVSHSEEESPKKPQGILPHGDSSSNNHKESHVILQVMTATEKKNPGKDQVTAALEVNSNHSIKEKSVMPQGMASQGNKTSCTQKKYPGIPRKVVGLRDSINNYTKEDSITTQEKEPSPILKKYPGILLKRPGPGSSLSCKQKEDPKTSQGTAALEEDNRNCKQDTITFQQMTLLATGGSPSERKDQVTPQGTGKSQNQKEEPNKFQASPLGKSKSENKCHPKKLPPKQKNKPPEGVIKAFESKPPQGVKVFESKPPEWVKAFESKPPQGVKAFESKPPEGVKAFESLPPEWVKAFETKPTQGVKAFESKPPQGVKAFESLPPEWVKAFESKPPQGVNSFQSTPPEWIKAFEIKLPEGVKTFKSKPPQGVKAFESMPPEWVKAFESKPPQGVKAFKSLPPEWVKAFESKPPQGVKAFESMPPEWVKAFEIKLPEGVKAFKSKPPEGVKAFESKPPQGIKAFESKLPQGVKAFESMPPEWVKAFEIKPTQGVKAFKPTPSEWVKAFESRLPKGVKAFKSMPPEWVKAFESKPPQGVKAFETKPNQGIKAFESKPPQGAKSSEAKQQEKAFLHHSQLNWLCPSCKAGNRSWCRDCHKCAKAGAQFEKKYLAPNPTC